MARPIRGTLFVTSFTATGNPGEYTLTNATYTNASDIEGNGASAIVVGFLVYVPAADINTFDPIPGVFHRYKLTAVTVVNSNTISGTILWDETGSEIDTPVNGAFCAITEASATNKLGYPSSQGVYPSLGAGISEAIYSADVKKIIDGFGSGGGATAFEKQMRNSNGNTLPAGTPVSKQSDGTFKQADSDAVNGQKYVGILKVSTANNAYGAVILPGANIVGAVTGLGFTPGDEVYLSETGGLTNDPNSFTGGDDSIIRIGIADCTGGTATSTADDLIIFTEVVARP